MNNINRYVAFTVLHLCLPHPLRLSKTRVTDDFIYFTWIADNYRLSLSDGKIYEKALGEYIGGTVKTALMERLFSEKYNTWNDDFKSISDPPGCCRCYVGNCYYTSHTLPSI